MSQNPFWDLVNTARSVESQNYQHADDQNHDLWDAVIGYTAADLSPQEFTTAFFRVVPDVYEKRVAPQAAFFIADVAATEARTRRDSGKLTSEQEQELRGLYSLRNAAHRVAAVAKAASVELLMMTELAELGLVMQRSNEKGAWWHAFIGKEAVREAADKLAEQGKHSGASILRLCLIRGARGSEAGAEVTALTEQIKESIKALKAAGETEAANDLFAQLQSAVSQVEHRAKRREDRANAKAEEAKAEETEATTAETEEVEANA